MAYVVDTNIINRLLDGNLQPGDLPDDGLFIATHIQIDELRRTPDPRRRNQLLAKFSEIGPEKRPTESTVIGTSRLSETKLGGGELFGKLKRGLDQRNKRKRSNIHDALIGEVAIKHKYTLLTADKDLCEVASNHGCKIRLYTS